MCRLLQFGFLVLSLFVVSESFAKSIKVMTLNVLADEYTDSATGSPADSYGKFPVWKLRRDLVLNIINHSKPDVFGLQEDSVYQRDSLSVGLNKYDFAEFSAKQSITYGRTKSLGSIFFKSEKFRLIDSGFFHLHAERNVTWVILEDKHSQDQWLFFNAHFYGGLSQEQMGHVIDAARELMNDRKFVLLGDFNALIQDLRLYFDDMPLAYDEKDSRQVFFVSENDTRGTSIQIGAARSIDHILTNQQIMHSKAEAWYSMLDGENREANFLPYHSDHGAVIVEIGYGSLSVANKLTPILQLLLDE